MYMYIYIYIYIYNTYFYRYICSTWNMCTHVDPAFLVHTLQVPQEEVCRTSGQFLQEEKVKEIAEEREIQEMKISNMHSSELYHHSMSTHSCTALTLCPEPTSILFYWSTM